MLGANLLGLLAIGSEDVGGEKGRSGYGTLWERASPSRRARLTDCTPRSTCVARLRL